MASALSLVANYDDSSEEDDEDSDLDEKLDDVVSTIDATQNHDCNTDSVFHSKPSGSSVKTLAADSTKFEKSSEMYDDDARPSHDTDDSYETFHLPEPISSRMSPANEDELEDFVKQKTPYKELPQKPRPANALGLAGRQSERTFDKLSEKTSQSRQTKQRVKISVPSLADFPSDDEDDGENKSSVHRAESTSKGFGLFSMLPAPKSDGPLGRTGSGSKRLFVPYSLSKSAAEARKAQAEKLTKVSKRAAAPTKPVPGSFPPPSQAPNAGPPEADEGDCMAEETVMGDGNFFSFTDDANQKQSQDHLKAERKFFLPEVRLPEALPSPSLQQSSLSLSSLGAVCPTKGENLADRPLEFASTSGNSQSHWQRGNLEVPHFLDYGQSGPLFVADQEASDNEYTDPQPHVLSADEQSSIDRKELARLQGVINKRKGEEINFVDVNADDAFADRPDNWQTKSLSEETAYQPKPKKGEGPSSQSKRKHQITFLAFQARERELDLKNSWAQNRMTRKQTQSRYGF